MGPERAVQELIERLQHLNGDPNATRAAFNLLSKRARANLEARAMRYGSASGKTIPAEAMLVPARFLLRFVPQHYLAQQGDGRAVVQVLGRLDENRATLPCVLEGGVWRVDLTFPGLPQLQVRPRSGPL